MLWAVKNGARSISSKSQLFIYRIWPNLFPYHYFSRLRCIVPCSIEDNFRRWNFVLNLSDLPPIIYFEIIFPRDFTRRIIFSIDIVLFFRLRREKGRFSGFSERSFVFGHLE